MAPWSWAQGHAVGYKEGFAAGLAEGQAIKREGLRKPAPLARNAGQRQKTTPRLGKSSTKSIRRRI
eukprot:10225455-Lingulodinium_polyedra.AAC.1